MKREDRSLPFFVLVEAGFLIIEIESPTQTKYSLIYNSVSPNCSYLILDATLKKLIFTLAFMLSYLSNIK